MRDLVHRGIERVLIRRRRLRGPADLPDVLQRGGVHLVPGRGRLEIVQSSNISAHENSLRARLVLLA